MSEDPRLRDDGLGWVSRALFDGDRTRVSVSSGRTPGPEVGWCTVGTFAVLPDVAHARFLLPLGSRRVTAASLLAYNALRGRRTRLARSALGQLARTGAAQLPLVPRLTVRIPSDVDAGDGYVVGHLADALQVPSLYAAIGVRPPDPHHKPTVQLFDEHAVPCGYAKVGWNPGTRALVRAETAALAALPAGGGYPQVPRLRYAGDWAGRTIAVVAPLPTGVRRVPRPGWPYPAELLAVARGGGPPAEPRAFGDSRFVERLTHRAQAAVAAGCQAGRRVTAALETLRERCGSTRLEFGDWHGDWVPWNLGVDGGRLTVWDWEHHSGDVPVGLDLAHHGFQCALTLAGQPAAAATHAAAAALREHGPALGLDPPRQRLVVDCYLLELWLRTWQLAAGGAGWNDRLHPAVLDVVAGRLERPAAQVD